MTYSLDSVYKAAEESRARRAAEEAEIEKELAAPLRVWKPPSFDPRSKFEPVRAPLPTVQEVEDIRAEAAQLGMRAGHEAGYAAGNKEGFAAGQLDGFQKGHEEGYQAGYDQAKAEIANLTEAYDIAERLAGQEGMDRSPFVQAVQEALMKLPKPGEKLFIRIRPQESESWKKASDDEGLPFRCILLFDENVPPGHAYVEAQGTRLDIGIEARRALVRTALGLDVSPE
jgi:flagellar assembly protein FliH